MAGHRRHVECFKFVLVAIALVTAPLYALADGDCGFTSTEFTFTATELVTPGNYILFSAILGQGSDTLNLDPSKVAYISFTNQYLEAQNLFTTFPVDGTLKAIASSPTPAVTYTSTGWTVTVPADSIGNTEVFIAANLFPITPAMFPGGATITWSGNFGSQQTLVNNILWYGSAANYGPALASIPPSQLKPTPVSEGATVAGDPTNIKVINLQVAKTSNTGPIAVEIQGQLCIPSAIGEPHFTGADGSHFDWSGHSNHVYNLLSDSDIQINMGMVGYYGKMGNEKNRSITWIRHMGILWNGHSLELSTRGGPEAAPLSGYMETMKFDGHEFNLAIGEEVLFAEDAIKVEYITNQLKDGDELIDLYEVTIKNVFSIRLKLRPEVENLRSATDAWVHFDFDLPVTKLSPSAHGVLGQTFRPDFSTKMAGQNLVHSKLLNWDMVEGENAGTLLDGTVEDYEEASIVSAGSTFSKYGKKSIPKMAGSRHYGTSRRRLQQADSSDAVSYITSAGYSQRLSLKL